MSSIRMLHVNKKLYRIQNVYTFKGITNNKSNTWDNHSHFIIQYGACIRGLSADRAFVWPCAKCWIIHEYGKYKLWTIFSFTQFDFRGFLPFRNRVKAKSLFRCRWNSTNAIDSKFILNLWKHFKWNVIQLIFIN